MGGRRWGKTGSRSTGVRVGGGLCLVVRRSHGKKLQRVVISTIWSEYPESMNI